MRADGIKCCCTPDNLTKLQVKYGKHGDCFMLLYRRIILFSRKKERVSDTKEIINITI